MIEAQKNIDSNAVNGQKFGDMNVGEKLAFLGKVCVFLISFGFAFPNIFSE